jgi:hypothetical protein
MKFSKKSCHCNFWIGATNKDISVRSKVWLVRATSGGGWVNSNIKWLASSCYWIIILSHQSKSFATVHTSLKVYYRSTTVITSFWNSIKRWPTSNRSFAFINIFDRKNARATVHSFCSNQSIVVGIRSIKLYHHFNILRYGILRFNPVVDIKVMCCFNQERWKQIVELISKQQLLHSALFAFWPANWIHVRKDRDADETTKWSVRQC